MRFFALLIANAIYDNTYATFFGARSVMKMSSNEMKVLGLIEHDCRFSYAQVASKINIPEHTVRHIVKKYTEDGLLRPRVYINPYRLGLSAYAITISCANLSSNQGHDFVSQLVEHELVACVIELGGGYSYHLEVLVRSTLQLLEFFHWLSTIAGGLVIQKQVSLQTSQHIFGFKFGMQRKREKNEVSYRVIDEHTEIDQIDHQILANLGEFPNVSQLNRQLNIPISTIDYRLKRLESAGIITGFCYEMTGTSLGLSSFILNIATKSFDEELAKQLHKFGAQHDNITYFNTDIGAWDFKFGVSLSRPEDLKCVEEELYQSFGSKISRIESLPRFLTLKARCYPFRKFFDSDTKTPELSASSNPPICAN